MPVTERLCFESELAAQILKQPSYFSVAIRKVSTAITSVLMHPDNQLFLKDNIILSDAVIGQLYSDTQFGVIAPSMEKCPTQSQFFSALLSILTKEQDNLPKILHIHQIFMQSIFEKLPFKSENPHWKALKDALVKVLFHNDLFSNARKKVKPLAGVLTRQIGIAGELACPRNSIASTDLHMNVLGVFEANSDSTWGRFITQHQLPFIAGPSGHVGSSILLAMVVGKLTKDELKPYLTTNMGVLVGGGYHTADEVMAVANLTGLPYQPGKYLDFLPDDFRCSESVKTLAAKYPALLSIEDCKPDPYLPMKESFAHGSIRGVSNVLERFSLKQGLSKGASMAVRHATYYGSFFGMKFIEHFNGDATSDCFTALYKSAIDTASMALVETAFQCTSALIQKYCPPLLRDEKIKALSYMGMFAYQAYSSKYNVKTVVSSTLLGAAAQLTVEAVGDGLLGSDKLLVMPPPFINSIY